jgi:hypothetical protein
LEEYGNTGNIEALKRGTPAVMEHYRSFKPLLKPYAETAESEKKAASKRELTALLKRLITAIDNFDLDGADEAIKCLDELRIPAECEPHAENLRAYIADVAADEAIESAKIMIEIIESLYM